jgi:hypothetical protein
MDSVPTQPPSSLNAALSIESNLSVLMEQYKIHYKGLQFYIRLSDRVEIMLLIVAGLLTGVDVGVATNINLGFISGHFSPEAIHVMMPYIIFSGALVLVYLESKIRFNASYAHFLSLQITRLFQDYGPMHYQWIYEKYSKLHHCDVQGFVEGLLYMALCGLYIWNSVMASNNLSEHQGPCSGVFYLMIQGALLALVVSIHWMLKCDTDAFNKARIDHFSALTKS